MPSRENGLLKDLFTLTLIVVIIVLPVRAFIASPFVVDGNSMVPTFHNFDYLIVDELRYRFFEPERGDVIVFRYPKNPSTFYIKRIVGLPGETVSIQRGVVTVTDLSGAVRTLPEPYITADDATYSGKVVLLEGEYFVLGDNRPNSSDSRVWGALPREDIVGRVFARLLPASKAALLPGHATYPTPDESQPQKDEVSMRISLSYAA